MLEEMEVFRDIGKVATPTELFAHAADFLSFLRIRHGFNLLLLALLQLLVPLDLLLVTVVPPLLVSEPVHRLSFGQLARLIRLK